MFSSATAWGAVSRVAAPLPPPNRPPRTVSAVVEAYISTSTQGRTIYLPGPEAETAVSPLQQNELLWRLNTVFDDPDDDTLSFTIRSHTGDETTGRIITSASDPVIQRIRSHENASDFPIGSAPWFYIKTAAGASQGSDDRYTVRASDGRGGTGDWALRVIVRNSYVE